MLPCPLLQGLVAAETAAWVLEEPWPKCCRQSSRASGGEAAPRLMGGLRQTGASSAPPQPPGDVLQTQAHQPQAGAGLLPQTQEAPAPAGAGRLPPTPVHPARARAGRPLRQACPAQARAELLQTPAHLVQAKAGQLPCSVAPWSPAASGASPLPCSVAPASCRRRCGGVCQGTQRSLEQCSSTSCGLAWWAAPGPEVSRGCTVQLSRLAGTLQWWCTHQTIRCQWLTRSGLDTEQQALRKLLQPHAAILEHRQAAAGCCLLNPFESDVRVRHITLVASFCCRGQACSPSRRCGLCCLCRLTTPCG